MKVSEILHKDANNLDIFRLICACMVIYGHAYALAPESGRSDIVGRLLGFDYSGSLAVKIFFFLSGLVVTNSLLEKQNPIQFVIARFFRIWPALFFTVTISALCLGAVFTNLSLDTYLKSSETYEYVYNNLAMQINYNLLGVFTENPYKNAVNGALWTLPYEVSAYIFLLGLFMVGVFNSKKIPIFIFCLILIDPVIDNKLIFTWLPKNHEVNLLAPCFAFGAILAFYKDRINIDINIFFGVWILYFIFSYSSYAFYFFYFALFFSILYISSLKFALKFKPKSDLSYGVYLWGFPVQQVMASLFSEYGVRFNQLSSILICIVLAFISWHLVEKRCINWGRVIVRKINGGVA